MNVSFAEHVDIDEAKSIFESNYSHVYFILYDTFVQAETNLKQRGKLIGFFFLFVSKLKNLLFLIFFVVVVVVEIIKISNFKRWKRNIKMKISKTKSQNINYVRYKCMNRIHVVSVLSTDCSFDSKKLLFWSLDINYHIHLNIEEYLLKHFNYFHNK